MKQNETKGFGIFKLISIYAYSVGEIIKFARSSLFPSRSHFAAENQRTTVNARENKKATEYLMACGAKKGELRTSAHI